MDARADSQDCGAPLRSVDPPQLLHALTRTYHTAPSQLISLQSLLCEPQPKDPQDAQVAKHYLSDRKGFDDTARYWTQTYAAPSNMNAAKASDEIGINQQAVQRLVEMGFDRPGVVRALRKTDGDENRAIDMADFEDSPPKRGVAVTDEQAEALVRRWTGGGVASIIRSSRGYNNRLYFVALDDGTDAVLKLCGRFWTKVKTETEVAGLSLVGAVTDVPVPRVLGWNSSRDEVDAEYVLLSRLEGTPLDVLWPQLDQDLRMSVVRQIAALVVKIKKIRPPAGAEAHGIIGNFAIDAECETDRRNPASAFTIGKTVDQGIGPWPSYTAYLRESLTKEMRDLETDPVFAQARPILLKRLKKFVSGIDTNERIPVCKQAVFTHGDLNMPNILVEPDTESDSMLVVGLLDWEWAGFFPPQDEYSASLDFLGDGAERTESSLAQAFFDVLESAGVATPRTMDGWADTVLLSELRDSIAHWSLKGEPDLSSADVVARVVEPKMAANRPDLPSPGFDMVAFARISGSVMTYDWGKLGSSSAVARLASATPPFKPDESKPYAELWMGTHPNAPAVLVESGAALKDVLTPTNLSPELHSHYAGDLPFLFKVQSIRKALSIQAHPDKALAKRLFEKSPHLYKDPNHKPEMVCVRHRRAAPPASPS
nr:hypothetical protein HK105_000853 [Polyrhizophydium stewartii]